MFIKVAINIFCRHTMQIFIPEQWLCFHLQPCSDVASLKHLSAPKTFRIHSTTSHSTSFRCEGWEGQINTNSKQFDIIFALWCAGNGKLWLLRLGSIICSIKNTNEDNKTYVSALFHQQQSGLLAQAKLAQMYWPCGLSRNGAAC